MPSKIGVMLSAPYEAAHMTETDLDETTSIMLEQLRTVGNVRFLEVPGMTRHFLQLTAASLRKRRVTWRMQESPTIYPPWREWKGLPQRLIDESVQDEENSHPRDIVDADRVVTPSVRPSVPRSLLLGEWLLCWNGDQLFWGYKSPRRSRHHRAFIAETQKEEHL